MGYAETLRRMQQHYRVIDDENQPLLQTNEWATMGFHCATGYFRPNVAAWLRVVYVVHNPANGYVKIGMTSHHDRGVYARIHEQAKSEPWEVVGLAIAVRPPRPWRREDAVVPNLDDDLRHALVVRGVVADVQARTLGRDWVALTQDGTAFLRAIELECWRRGHAWLEPNGLTDDAPGAGGGQSKTVEPGNFVTEESFRYADLYRAQQYPQPLMWRTAFGPVKYGSFLHQNLTDAAQPPEAEHDAAGLDGEPTPVLAYVVMTGIKRSLPYVFRDDDDGGAGVSQKVDKMESQAFASSQADVRERSASMSSADSAAQRNSKRVRVDVAEKKFAGLYVVNHDDPTDVLADNDVVYVEENGKKMWDFSPVWDNAMLDFVTQLHGVEYNRQLQKINGFVGIVRKLEIKSNGFLHFRLYWQNQNTNGWEYYPYKVARKKVHRIGKIQDDGLDLVDNKTATAQESQSLGFAPGYIKMLRF